MHARLFQLYLTILLALIPFISASSYASQVVVHQDLQPGLPQGWTEFGCWTSDPERPTLTSFAYRDAVGMTIEECVAACIRTNASIAGLEQGTDCHCGDSLTSGSTLVPVSDCSTPCVGNPAESCGGINRLHMFWNGMGSAPPTIVQKVNQWEFMGCFNDSYGQGSLTSRANVDQFDNSVETCTSACHGGGFSLAGMVLAQQCFCDNKIQNGGHIVDTSLCTFACSGNGAEICGGPGTLVVYSFVP